MGKTRRVHGCLGSGVKEGNRQGPSMASSRAGPAHSRDPGRETRRTMGKIRKRPYVSPFSLRLRRGEGRCSAVISRPIFFFFFFNFARDEERKVRQGSENTSHSPDSENCLDLVLIASRTVL